MKFRKKPIVIEAYQYRKQPVPENFGNYVCEESHKGIWILPHIHTLEGAMVVSENDWIIKGIAGEFYPCKPDIFEKTYEPVDEGIEGIKKGNV